MSLAGSTTAQAQLISPGIYLQQQGRVTENMPSFEGAIMSVVLSLWCTSSIFYAAMTGDGQVLTMPMYIRI